MNAVRQIQTRNLLRMSSRLISGPTFQNSTSKFFAPQLASTKNLLLINISRTLATTSNLSEELEKRIEGCIKSGDVVVFMKGVPEAPRCGFSNAVCQILRMHDVTFKSYDVLADEQLRSGVKDFSKWPTFPQVFFKGELIGGCDILLQMHQSGDLIEELEKIGIKSALLQTEDGGQSDKK